MPRQIRTITTLYSSERDAVTEEWPQLRADEDLYVCEPDAVDLEGGVTAVDIAVDTLQHALGAIEPSSVPFAPGSWYSAESFIQPLVGEREEQTAHLEGFTEDEERLVYSRLVAVMFAAAGGQ